MKEKLLIITSRDSQRTNIKNGGTALTRATISALSGQFDLTEFPIIPTSCEAGLKKLLEYSLRIFFSIFGYSGGLYPWTERKLLDLLENSKTKYVYIDHSLYGRLAKTIKKRIPELNIISHFHNIEFLYYRSVSGHPFLKKLLSNSAKLNEQLAARYADKVIALTDRDSQLIKKYYGRTPDAIIPICLPDPISKNYTSEIPLPKLFVLFCGSYFKPNNEGVLWFVNNVLPHICVDLVIAGHNMEKLLPLINNKRVTVINSAPNLDPIYQQAIAVVAPIFTGTGMKTKTIEALSYGKKIFATAEALVGIEYQDRNDIKLCNDSDEFINSISKMLDEVAKVVAPQRSESNYELFLSKYSSVSKERMIKLLFQ